MADEIDKAIQRNIRDKEVIKFMQGFKKLPMTERRNAVKNLSREQKGQFNEMNKKYGSYLKDQRTLEKRKAATKGGGGGTFTQFGASGKRGAEKMRKNPFELNKGGKIKKSKIRGSGIAKKGVRPAKMR
tara:strand:- start:427 stop:813 length:387 start_codon:yes stop_codon:yes gene_type:complete